MVSAKNQGKAMHYRSSYERDVYLCLESMGEVAQYEVEPVAIEYWHNGKQKRYYPDLVVHFADGSTAIWEVKPRAQKKWPVNVAKWAFCRSYCELRGWQFEVIDEKRIREMKRNVRPNS